MPDQNQLFNKKVFIFILRLEMISSVVSYEMKKQIIFSTSGA